MRGASPLLAAVQVLPLAATLMPTSRLAPALTDRFGTRTVCAAGLTVMAGGLAVIAGLGTDTSYWQMATGLVLLGIGSDGHLASLFPDQSSLSERSRLVVGVEQAGLEPFVSRVSLTFPALVNSRQIVLLATGASKAAAVAAAFGPDARPDPHVPS